MKQTVFGIILAMIFMILLACNLTISGRNVRQNELNQALNQSAEQAVEGLLQKDGAVSNEKLLADIAERVLSCMESNGDVRIDVLDCDAEKGMLSVRATAPYKHVNGKEGTVSVTRTVILEQYAGV